jgi:putative peptidoglycan lipid II flippase
MARGLMQSVLGTGFSRVMGAFRDIAIGHVFGAGRVSDAFWVAFTVPSVFRRFVADEGLTGILVPAIQHAEAEEGQEAGWNLARSALAVLLLACGAICIVGILGAPWLVSAFAWGFTSDPEQFQLTVTLTRMLFPFVLLVSLLSWCEGMLNLRRHFFLPKMAPGFVGGAMAGSALLLTTHFDEPTYALVVGTLVGGLIQVLICLPRVIRTFGLPIPRFQGLGSPRLRGFIKAMGEVAIIGIFAQLNLMVLRLLASLLEPGSVTHYWYATRINDLAQGIIAVGVGSAALPELASAVASKDWDRFRGDLAEALRLVSVLLIPAAALTFALAMPITSVLFLHGEFELEDARQTAATLRMMLPFMLALGGIHIFKRAYFALDDRRLLMGVACFGLLLTASLGWVLSTRMGVAGLALGLSVATALQLAAYVLMLPRRTGKRMGLRALGAPLLRMTAAAVPAAMLSSFVARIVSWDGGSSLLNFGVLAAAGLAGLVLYSVLASALGIAEMQAVLRRLGVRRTA